MQRYVLPAIITGERLHLRVHRESDAELMFAAIDTDREHLRFMPWQTRTKSAVDVATYISLTHVQRDQGDMFDYGIWSNDPEPAYLGNIGLHTIKWNHHCAEIGYWIRSAYQGKGLLSEALNLLEASAFQQGFHRLEIRCAEDNLRSTRVALRNYYRLEATLRADQWERGHFRNTIVFGKLSPEHFKRHPHAQWRRALPSDAKGIHEVHMRSIRDLCAGDYTPEQIQAWGGRALNEEKWHQSIAHDMVWVIDRAGSIKGMCHVARHGEEALAEVQALYFAPEITGQGMGKAIIAEMISWARWSGISRLVLNSTKTAKGFYLKMGFTPTECESKLFMVNNVGIDCHPMELLLESSS